MQRVLNKLIKTKNQVEIQRKELFNLQKKKQMTISTNFQISVSFFYFRTFKF